MTGERAQITTNLAQGALFSALSRRRPRFYPVAERGAKKGPAENFGPNVEIECASPTIG